MLDRNTIDQTDVSAELAALGIAFDSIDDRACALLAYQRTKQTSRKARVAWEAGDKDVLLREAAERRTEIVTGALEEVYREYLPLKAALGDRSIGRVCDVGCGQGINDVFLHLEAAPAFTLVDIEHTENQYHFWSDEGAGYASLSAARALLEENGAAPERIETINPTRTEWAQAGGNYDLVTSLYSCGFHYPIDAYLELFVDTVSGGGVVCLDLRRRYLRRESAALDRLKAAGAHRVIYEDARSFRMLFGAP